MVFGWISYDWSFSHQVNQNSHNKSRKSRGQVFLYSSSPSLLSLSTYHFIYFSLFIVEEGFPHKIVDIVLFRRRLHRRSGSNLYFFCQPLSSKPYLTLKPSAQHCVLFEVDHWLERREEDGTSSSVRRKSNLKLASRAYAPDLNFKPALSEQQVVLFECR